MRGGNGWESNPPRLATRPDTDFEDREAHRDLTTPNGNNLSQLDYYTGWTMIEVTSDLIYLRHDKNNKMLRDLFS